MEEKVDNVFISNRFVMGVAFMPLLFGVMRYFLFDSAIENLSIPLAWVMYGFFLKFDKDMLEQNGCDVMSYGKWGWYIPAVYLFKRARRLGSYKYFIIHVLAFFISIYAGRVINPVTITYATVTKAGIAGDYDKAIALSEQFIEKHPKFQAPFLYTLSFSYLSKNNYKEALNWSEKALKDGHIGAFKDTILVINISAKYMLGNLQDASQVAEKWAASSPENIDQMNLLGCINFAKGEKQLAVRQLQKAVGLPGNKLQKASAEFNLGLVMLFSGGMVGNKQHFEKAMEGGDEALQAISKGFIALSSGRYPEAETFARESIQKRPTEDGYFLLGLSLEFQKSMEPALESYEKCIQLCGSYVEAYARAGWLALRLGKRNLAQKYATGALTLNPHHVMANKVIQSLQSPESSE